MKIRLFFSDILIIALVCCITCFTAYNAYLRSAQSSFVMIRGQNSEWTFPINAAETIAVPGPIGQTTVRIEENRAWVESSPCDNQNCVASGVLTKQGQWAACLPNNVLLIMGRGGGDVDAVVW